MRSETQHIEVNGSVFEIQYEMNKSPSILSVNKVNAIYLAVDFIDDCEFAVSNFEAIKPVKIEEN